MREIVPSKSKMAWRTLPLSILLSISIEVLFSKMFFCFHLHPYHNLLMSLTGSSPKFLAVFPTNTGCVLPKVNN